MSHSPEISIKDGIVTISNPSGSHWYQGKEGMYPSVTTITDYAPKGMGFKQWLGNTGSWEEAEKIKTDAGARGTRVHNACEDILRGGRLTYEDYALECPNMEQAISEWKMIVSFGQWIQDHSPRLIKDMIEVKVISEEHQYGGSFDFACVLGDNKYLIDIKTGKKVYSSYWLQLNAYNEAAKEMGLPKFNQLAVLRLGSHHKAGYEFAIQDPCDQDFINFLACKQLWHMENPNAEGPEVIEMPAEVSVEVPVF